MGCFNSKPLPGSGSSFVPHTSAEILTSIETSVPRLLTSKHTDRRSVDDDLVDDLGSPTAASLAAAGSPADLLSPALPRSVKETFQLKVGVLEGTTFLNNYVVVDTLGRGSHGKVKLCLNVADNHLYAIKIVETVALRKGEKSRLGRTKRSALGRSARTDTRSTAERSTTLSSVSMSPMRQSTRQSTVSFADGGDDGGEEDEEKDEAEGTEGTEGAEEDGSMGGGLPSSHLSSRLESAYSSLSNLQALEREADLMKALNHPNLVRLYEVIRSDSSGKLLMVMEYCHAGPLVDDKGRFSHCQDDIPEIIVHHFFKQMTSAIQYLHSEGIVHGDIKPENMLLSGDGTVKIADFGQSLKIMGACGKGKKSSMLTRTLGTPAYLAPEICAGEEYDGFAADVWALGVTLYSFMFGRLPFEGTTVVDLYDTIAEQEVRFPEGRGLSIELQDLFLRLLHKNPKYRITADELVAHPWVATADRELDEVEQMFGDDDSLPIEFRVTRGSTPSPVGGTPTFGGSARGSRGSSPGAAGFGAGDAGDGSGGHPKLSQREAPISGSSEDGHDGEIGPDPDAIRPTSRSPGLAPAPYSTRAAKRPPEQDDGSFGLSVMRSLSRIVREGTSSFSDATRSAATTTTAATRAASTTTAATGAASTTTAATGSPELSLEVPLAETRETSLEEFNSIADTLLKSQKSLLEHRKRRSPLDTANTSLTSIRESGDIGPPTTATSASTSASASARPASSNQPYRPVQVSKTDAGSLSAAFMSPFNVGPASVASAFDEPTVQNEHQDQHQPVVSVIKNEGEAMRTAGEADGAALMHFEAGEYIDGFGHGDQQYAYYIDAGEVDIRYMADLPVPFDDVVGNCFEDVIQSHYSIDLAHVDSVCYTENTSRFVFAKPDRGKSSGFSALPSLRDLQTAFEKLSAAFAVDESSSGSADADASVSRTRRSSGPNPSANPSADRRAGHADTDLSVHRFVEQSEMAMRGASKGKLGDLLTATRSEGQFIGALSLLNPEYFQNKWRFSAVATTDVVIIKMTRDALQRFLMVHPLSQVTLRASMSHTVSELVKLEMYERISLARRRMMGESSSSKSRLNHSSSSVLSAANQGFEEIARHLTSTAMVRDFEPFGREPSLSLTIHASLVCQAGAEVLAKLDLFALASRLREDAQGSLGLRGGPKSPEYDI